MWAPRIKHPGHDRSGTWLPVLFLLLAGCATNPVTQRDEFVLMSETQELNLGQAMAREVEKQLPLMPENDPLVRYVDRVGQKVAAKSDRPGLFYRFHVVDDATINAFALPGGYIYVHRGLVHHMNSEAELAAVLGHEIGHVTARHAVQRYTQAQGYQLGMAVASIFVPMPRGINNLTDAVALAIIQGYGREAELQSDELSLKYLAAAGYDPQATVHILETLKRLDDIRKQEKRDAGDKVEEEYHGAFSSHPETEKRIREAAAKAGSGGMIGHEAMLAAIDGYPYGDSPEQGAVVGNRFLHPDLGIQLEFPERWIIKNTPQALTARVRQQKVFFQLSMRDLQKRESAADILRAGFPARHMGPVSEGVRNGFSFAHAVVNVSAPQVSEARVHATVLLDGPRAYSLMMWSDRKQFADYRADFDAIAATFRRYDPKRDGDVPRIAIHTWEQGDSWQALAEKSGNILGRFTADKLAALNGLGPDEAPAPGTPVKIVR